MRVVILTENQDLRTFLVLLQDGVVAQTYQQYGPLLSLVWAGEQGVAAGFKTDNVCLIFSNLRTSSL